MTLMERRRALMAAAKKSRIPAEYQEVEWIGGNGMPDPAKFPYISPKIAAKEGDAFIVHFKPIQMATECPVIGQKKVPQIEIFYKSFAAVETYNMKANPTLIVGTPYDIITAYGNTATRNATYNVAYWSNDAKYVSEYRVFYLLHTRSGVPLVELIPCYRKSDGKIGMYDTVGKRFLTNAGTGLFTKGPDVT